MYIFCHLMLNLQAPVAKHLEQIESIMYFLHDCVFIKKSFKFTGVTVCVCVYVCICACAHACHVKHVALESNF